MALDPALVDAMLARHGVSGPWAPLPRTGLANDVYATSEVVLRVATDHPDGIPDARTESIAAPVARAAGILTPALIAFDDSRTLVDRPFSLWERVHADTLGAVALAPRETATVWWQVGRELSRVHQRVRACADPCRYLDEPVREQGFETLLRGLTDAGRIGVSVADEVEALVEQLRPHVAAPVDLRFLHNDVHAMNVMCTSQGALRAIIDWGDAGWGGPTLEFAQIPVEALGAVRDGYESESPGGLGPLPEARFVWDKLHKALRRIRKGTTDTVPLAELRRVLEGEAARPERS